eukprot:gene9030-1128_t
MSEETVDRLEEAEALESIFDSNFKYLKKNETSTEYQITISDDILESEKLTASLNVVCHPKVTEVSFKFEGPDLPRAIILRIDKDIKELKEVKGATIDIFEVVTEIKEKLLKMAEKSKNERQLILEQTIIEEEFTKKEEIKKNEKKQNIFDSKVLNTRKYSEMSQNSKNNSTSVFYDNFVHLSPAYHWEEQFDIKDKRYFVQQNDELVHIILMNAVHTYDIRKDKWTTGVISNDMPRFDFPYKFISTNLIKIPISSEFYDAVCLFGAGRVVVLKETTPIDSPQPIITQNDQENPSLMKKKRAMIIEWEQKRRRPNHFYLSKHSIFEDLKENVPELIGHTSENLNDSNIIIFGGFNLNTTKFSNDFFQLEIKRNDPFLVTFSPVVMTGDVIPARAGHSSVRMSDQIYIYGGTGEDQEVLSDMYVVDTSEKIVKKIFIRGPAPSITLGLGLHIFEDNLLAYGGFDGENNSTEMYLFDMKHERWSIVQQVKNLDDPHICGHSAMVHGKLMLIGGFSDVNPEFYSFKSHYGFTNIIQNRKCDVYSHIEYYNELSSHGHHSELCKDLTRWFRSQDEENSDLVFNFGYSEKRIYAHKLIIEITCPELYKLVQKSMENQQYYEEKTQVTIEFDEKISFLVFGTFIDSLYNFGLQIKSDSWGENRFEQLYYIAKLFKNDILVELLEGHLNFATIQKNNMQYQLKKNYLKYVNGEIFSSSRIPDPINGLVHFVFEDEILYAHKGLITNRCPYFKSMFSMVGFKEVETNTIDVPEDIGKNAIKLILEYLYTGFLPEISISDSISVYYAVSLYDIAPLKPFLRQIIRDNLSLGNAFDVCYFSDLLKDEFMNNFCSSYIFKHLKQVEKTEEYESLPQSIKSIINDKISKEKKKNRKSQE